jgi:hypothetical protein
MSKTFLDSARRHGLRLFPGSRALRLERKSRSWLIPFLRDGRREYVEAQQVFVCGGAIHTPLLLRSSGFRHRIGDSLALHPTVKVVARFPEEVNHEQLGVPVHQVKHFSPRMSFGCSISSLPHIMLGLVDYPEHRARMRGLWKHAANYYAMVTGPAIGRIRRVPLSIEPFVRYQVGPEELRDLSLGLHRLCQLLFAAGAVELFPSIAGMAPLTGPDQLSQIPYPLDAKQTSLMTIHLFSSCPMGENQAVAACDSFGRVHGARNLSVHDASLLCTAPGVNPQGSVMAFAHRNTLHYLEALRGV